MCLSQTMTSLATPKRSMTTLWRRLGALHQKGISLFWRTFLLLTALLMCSVLAWLFSFKTLEETPRAVQGAQQLASLVNLTRAAMVHADPFARISLVSTLVEEENVRIGVRDTTDTFSAYNTDALSRRISDELALRLGPETVVAREVNGFEGLWIGFVIDQDSFWLLADPARVGSIDGTTWLVWVAIGLGLSLLGAVLMARLLNYPLQQLTAAAGAIQMGRFAEVELDERVATRDVQVVNRRFNLMARQLGQTEQDRVLMLAGISHDLRTPLARLRLEAELSVADADARDHMAHDIEQVTGIIDKFLDYARAQPAALVPLELAPLLTHILAPYEARPDCCIHGWAPSHLWVMGDAVELKRVVVNLVENALRYGRSADGRLDLLWRVDTRGEWLDVSWRDHGRGVAPELLHRLKDPFFRADTARTAATGSGLGLAIVNKTLERMGGELKLSLPPEGGLQATLVLRKAATG